MTIRIGSLAVATWLCGTAGLTCSSPAQGVGIVVYVDDSAPQGGDGLTWQSPFIELQTALAFATVPGNNVAEIHVGQGTYRPDETADSPGGNGIRQSTFALQSGLALRGGYAGFGAIDPEARDVAGFATILSGDLLSDDLPGSQNISDNSYHIVTASDVDRSAIIEGFTIRDGNTSGSADGGSAITITNAHPTIAACTITSNYTTEPAPGAIYAKGGGLNIQECLITANEVSADDGAALVVEDSDDAVSIINCTFTVHKGQGVRTSDVASFLIDNCTFSMQVIGVLLRETVGVVQNSVFTDNARFGIDGNCTVVNCVFDDHGSGAINTDDLGELEIIDCTFTNNLIGIRELEGIDVDVHGCDFIDNHVAILNHWSGSLTVDESNFQANDRALDNVGSNAHIVNSTFADNSSSAIRHDDGLLRLEACEFTNNHGAYGGAIDADFGGQFSVSNCLFTENSATYRGGAVYSRDSSTANPDSHVFVNCVFYDNMAGQRGGALFIHGVASKLINCTLVRNEAPSGKGGAIYVTADAILRLRNSIVRHNWGGGLAGPGSRTVYYSNIQGGHTGIGNIAKDAKFMNLETGDLRLKPTSPCIDAGRKSYLLDQNGKLISTTDIEGNLRLINAPAVPNTGNGTPPVDMGAYEFQP